MAWVALVAASVFAFAFIFLSESEKEPPQPARSAGAAAPAKAAPPCRSVDVSGRLAEPVTCRASRATLTIADQSDPLLLEGLQVRATRPRISGDTLSVRLRVRNTTDSRQIFDRTGRQAYLSLAGQRIAADPPLEASLAPDEARTVEASFPLGDRAAGVRRSRSAELGVLPWSEIGRSAARAVGVIRLRPRVAEPPAAEAQTGEGSTSQPAPSDGTTTTPPQG